MKRFKIEDKYGDHMMYITVHNPPYEDADVISHTKLKNKQRRIVSLIYHKHIIIYTTYFR